MIEKTKYASLIINDLPEGCKLCVKGNKTVIFITGVCSQNCFYCPLSEKKKNKDVIFVNERPLKDENDFNSLIEEAESHNSKGAGITGGDPLSKIDRTVSFIKKLKDHFGKKYHIHLYTPLILVDKEKLNKLYSAGLDEIRFHPDIFDSKYWDRISLAKEFNWDKGIEIPVIPGAEEQTIKLLDFVKDKVDFINLNELEYSDTNAQQLFQKNLFTKDELSYAIKNSDLAAKKLLRYIDKKIYPYYKIKVHFCTAKTKDRFQLTNRMKLKAMNTKLPVDLVSKDGMLMRGCIYLREMFNDNYQQKKIDEGNKEQFIKKLKVAKQELSKIFKNKIYVDLDKLRLIVEPKKLISHVDKIPDKFLCALVEENPTYDKLEVTVNFLN